MAKKLQPEQLPLHLPLQAASAREDLVVSNANAEAVAFLDSWPDWPTSIALLAGPTGAGKTHLAHIWAARAGGRFIPANSTDMPEEGNLVVEDVARGAFSETWLFHLINQTRAAGNSLLITSRRWPASWGVALPDLQSRLNLAHIMELREPDDDLLKGVMVKLFSDRQLMVDPAVIDYVVLRMERSLASALQLVERLDQLSLAEQRAITKPLVAETLREIEEG